MIAWKTQLPSVYRDGRTGRFLPLIERRWPKDWAGKKHTLPQISRYVESSHFVDNIGEVLGEIKVRKIGSTPRTHEAVRGWDMKGAQISSFHSVIGEIIREKHEWHYFTTLSSGGGTAGIWKSASKPSKCYGSDFSGQAGVISYQETSWVGSSGKAQWLRRASVSF